MGDDLSLEERESVRTVMQWSCDSNGGFSTAPPERWARTVIAGGEYGFESVNVEAQQRDPNSLLHWMTRMIHTRKQCPEIGWGEWKILETGDPAVFAMRHDWRGSSVIAVHNLAGREATARLALDGEGGQQEEGLVELIGDNPHSTVDRHREIPLEPYGYRWFRMGERAAAPVLSLELFTKAGPLPGACAPG